MSKIRRIRGWIDPSVMFRRCFGRLGFQTPKFDALAKSVVWMFILMWMLYGPHLSSESQPLLLTLLVQDAMYLWTKDVPLRIKGWPSAVLLRMQIHLNAQRGLTNDVFKDAHRDVITEGTGSRSRDGAEDLFLLAEHSVLSTYCDALHLHVIFLT